MHITDVSIRLEPSKGEDTLPVTLHRTNKEWYVICEDGGLKRGLFPSELWIAYLLQNGIIIKYQSGRPEHKKEIIKEVQEIN